MKSSKHILSNKMKTEEMRSNTISLMTAMKNLLWLKERNKSWDGGPCYAQKKPIKSCSKMMMSKDSNIWAIQRCETTQIYQHTCRNLNPKLWWPEYYFFSHCPVVLVPVLQTCWHTVLCRFGHKNAPKL